MAGAGEIDFAALRRRLDRAGAEASSSDARTPEQRRAILEARARALAGTKDSEDGATVPAFVFEVGGDRYAVGLEEVVQVMEGSGLSPIPGAPPWLLGALAARSRIVPVLDPRRLLGVAREGISDLTHVLVLRHRGDAVGIAVESLAGELKIPEADLQKPSVAGPFRWTTSDGLTRLDLDRLFAKVGEP